MLRWVQYSLDGAQHFVKYTYHDIADGWYFDIPEDWQGHLLLSRSDITLGATIERSITFYYQENPSDTPNAFMTIYKNMGTNRITRAEIGQRQLLQTDSDAAYSIELLDCDWVCGLDYVSAASQFHLILTDWSATD